MKAPPELAFLKGRLAALLRGVNYPSVGWVRIRSGISSIFSGQFSITEYSMVQIDIRYVIINAAIKLTKSKLSFHANGLMLNIPVELNLLITKPMLYENSSALLIRK